jgi:hypothetical protein
MVDFNYSIAASLLKSFLAGLCGVYGRTPTA